MRLFETDSNQKEIIEGITTEYPYTMLITDFSDFSVPWHWHVEVELGYMEKGSMTIYTPNAEYTVNEGFGFFINTNVLDMKKNASPENEAFEVNNVFHPTFLAGHFQSLIQTKYLNPVLDNREIEVYIISPSTKFGNMILRNLHKLKEINSKKDMEIETRNILSSTWLLLMHDMEENMTSITRSATYGQNRIRVMLAYIQKYYMNHISISEIAESANVSEREVHRSFRKYLNTTPSEYLMQYRVNQARNYLDKSELSISEIALETGFTDSAYFGKIFRKYSSMTPSQYREKSRSHTILP